jgi:hypothetical protein
MAEYIDRDELLKELCTVSAPTPSESWIVEKCIEKVNEQPTADVVPKSEVETLKSLITRKEDEAYERGYAEGKADVVITNYAKEVKEYAREIFAEIEKNTGFFRVCAERNYDYLCIFRELDELKKKYTEGKNEH